MRVQTKWTDTGIKFIQDDGKAIDFANEFVYNNKQYSFLGGFYYDLDPSLIDHIFGA